MIVNRHIWILRDGHTRDEAMTLFEEFPTGGPKASRVLSSGYVSPSDGALIFEFEFEDLAALDKEWDAWLSRPEATAFMNKWTAICGASSHKSEVWTVLR